jgi:PhzF family phenazine biosynthesis protein
MEMNQAETAFLLTEGDHYRLRWFTPTHEVDLCGHATLASAHFLWETGRLPKDRTARFETRSGTLSASPGPFGMIELDFPATRPTPTAAPEGLLPALGVSSGTVFDNRKPQPDYLVLVENAGLVRSLAPDLGRIRGLKARGVIVTAPSDRPGIDFVSRFFAPAFGVDEDPVTGSAHCTLAPFWTDRLGRNPLVGYQASQRGGQVEVEVRADRVALRGRAVTVVRGSVEVPR